MEKGKVINAPEGFEIEKVEIVNGAAVVTFKKKEQILPKSWEEFCEMFPDLLPYNFVIQKHDLYPDDFIFLQSYNNRLIEEMKKFTGDRATAESVLALCQLIQMRDCYNGDWVPDWDDEEQDKYVITFVCCDEITITDSYNDAYSPLYFKNEKLAKEFLRCFRPLIEKLKPLYGIKEGGEE